MINNILHVFCSLLICPFIFLVVLLMNGIVYDFGFSCFWDKAVNEFTMYFKVLFHPFHFWDTVYLCFLLLLLPIAAVRSLFKYGQNYPERKFRLYLLYITNSFFLGFPGFFLLVSLIT